MIPFIFKSLHNYIALSIVVVDILVYFIGNFQISVWTLLMMIPLSAPSSDLTSIAIRYDDQLIDRADRQSNRFNDRDGHDLHHTHHHDANGGQSDVHVSSSIPLNNNQNGQQARFTNKRQTARRGRPRNNYGAPPKSYHRPKPSYGPPKYHRPRPSYGN